ncbi:sterol desaturase [Wenyingzhuangia fucanilytica]|uniref:Sterol desaturase n=2 Tax=Wenyingzhuangia fucanilytica TaxID=1790137 RepID=A0A1B1Y6U9_9FLAO|nr:sterol desaturase family protein [Wenyingzhuangia fucanilytica]ANW96469.1 sterol desaturase [Wenyingzhuangia fucanilytica]
MDIFFNSFNNTIYWIINMVALRTPWYQNYFWGLIIISFSIWLLEVFVPWRKRQSIFRKDFDIDFFYMFFNFFIFAIVINGVYALVGNKANEYGVTMKSFTLINLDHFNPYQQLIIFFVLSDFLQWITHIILHRVPWFWKFHQIHHSTKEMGFAAHLRYHWMENILYKPLKTFAIMLIGGFEPEQAYIVHFTAIVIGHLNHSNLNITWGPLKYILNNPVMHLYHHAYELPENKKHGVNYGISLSIWDYIFRTNYLPKVDKYLKLGFEGDDKIPQKFSQQFLYGFVKLKKDKPNFR